MNNHRNMNPDNNGDGEKEFAEFHAMEKLLLEVEQRSEASPRTDVHYRTFCAGEYTSNGDHLDLPP
jgi:hypothetical protein